ncbi:hypothetical protein NKH48_19390 [Mesorhizobium sp. M1233]|uniref:hypothetical protein n=1 Tax=Mesorhizobium sp. M1233 TaxID=2957072 RepID=UPI00333CC205
MIRIDQEQCVAFAFVQSGVVDLVLLSSSVAGLVLAPVAAIWSIVMMEQRTQVFQFEPNSRSPDRQTPLVADAVTTSDKRSVSSPVRPYPANNSL